jgi:hypothetical protein
MCAPALGAIAIPLQAFEDVDESLLAPLSAVTIRFSSSACEPAAQITLFVCTVKTFPDVVS